MLEWIIFVSTHRFVASCACCLCVESLDGVPTVAGTEAIAALSFCDVPGAAAIADGPKLGPTAPLENSPDFEDNGE